jgi:hypothetical protein
VVERDRDVTNPADDDLAVADTGRSPILPMLRIATSG